MEYASASALKPVRAPLPFTAPIIADGVIVDASYWSYDPSAKMVVLTETDGAGTHDWVVAP